MNLRASALLRVWAPPAGAAAVCMLLGAACAYAFVQHPSLALGAARPVVVTTRDLARGEVLSRAMLDFRELPERYLEERHVHGADLERVLGGRLGTPLSSGSSLLWSDLALRSAERSLSSLLQTGMRGVHLPDVDVEFARLLRPGDRVDVLFTPASGVTGTLLENALVLSVGRDLGDELELPSEPSDPPASITLAVTREQAQRLAASDGRGLRRLALRNPQDVLLADDALVHAGDQP